jgi:hypothetical protein
LLFLPACGSQAGLHRDSFLVPPQAGYRHWCPVLRQVTLTNFIAGPLCGIPATDLTFSKIRKITIQKDLIVSHDLFGSFELLTYF